MENITNYILEGLKINANSKVNQGADKFNEDDFIYPVRTKSGKEFKWFSWWKHLMDNGPMTKHDLLVDFDLQPTSYGTEFAKLSKRNIIVPSHGKLEAKKPSEWKYIKI